MSLISNNEHEWIRQRNRCLHMTNYPCDYEQLDADKLIKQFKDWKITVFSFFAAGYTTMYPSDLEWLQESIFVSDDRDICREILEAANKAGIVAIPTIDIGDMPAALAKRHPDWAMHEKDGSLRIKAGEYIVSSLCGPYRRNCARELVGELKARYGSLFKAIKWGGASYGFGGGIDYNPHAESEYLAATGCPLPDSKEDTTYRKWRENVMAENVQRLTAIAHEEAGVPTIGNSIWNLGEGQHFNALAKGQDVTQVEVQTRTWLTQDDDFEGGWERFSVPVETTRYISGLTKNPPIVVASYFLAWPWRRIAVPPAEQKVYLAQIASNGGSPMVNMTAGTPEAHEDQRGFPAIRQLYRFMADNADCFEQDSSAASVAIVYDHASAVAARQQGNLYRYYLHEMHQVQKALDIHHLPYEILDSNNLDHFDSARIKALIIPGAKELTPSIAEKLASLSKEGVGLVLDGSTCQSELMPALGLNKAGDAKPFTQQQEVGPCQVYLRVLEAKHPATDWTETTRLAAAGHWYPMETFEGFETLIDRSAPIRVFPEAVATPAETDPCDPLVQTGSYNGKGKVMLLSFDAGRCAMRTGHPDNLQLIKKSLEFVAGGYELDMPGFPDIQVSVRKVSKGRTIHLINTAARHRFMTEFCPMHDSKLRLKAKGEPVSVELRGDKEQPKWHYSQGYIEITLPKLTDYAILFINESLTS